MVTVWLWLILLVRVGALTCSCLVGGFVGCCCLYMVLLV